MEERPELFTKKLKPWLHLMDEGHTATGYVIEGDDKVAKSTIPPVHTLALDPHLGPVLGLGLHLELDFRTVAEGNNHLAT